MKEKLLELGWKMYYECDLCQGHMQFFTNEAFPGYEIRIKIRNNTFSILLKNLVIAGPFWGYDIEKKVQAHVK